MDMAPEFIGKPISLDGSRRLHELKVKATEMLSLIQETKPSNENARMIALARTKLEEVIFWITKAISRELPELTHFSGEFE